MKIIKEYIVLSILILVAYTVSAQQTKYKKLSDVVVEKLETVCDCADAKAIGIKEELAAKKKGGFTKEEAKSWELKSKEISSHCFGKKMFSMAKMRECPSMVAVKKEMDSNMKEKQLKKEDKVNFDKNVAEVCSCFKAAKSAGKAPSYCYQMQSKYAKLQGDRKKEFIQATNICP